MMRLRLRRWRSAQALAFRPLAIALTLGWMLVGGGVSQLAWATTSALMLELAVQASVPYDQIKQQAEALAIAAAAQQFSTQADLATVTVAVVGDREGMVVPILTMTLSRQDWQAGTPLEPQIQYYTAHCLLAYRPHQGEPASPAPHSGTGAASPSHQAAVDRALDDGRLTGAAIQSYLSNLD